MRGCVASYPPLLFAPCADNVDRARTELPTSITRMFFLIESIADSFDRIFSTSYKQLSFDMITVSPFDQSAALDFVCVGMSNAASWNSLKIIQHGLLKLRSSSILASRFSR